MAEHNQRFDSHQQWVNKASIWLTRHPDYCEFFKAICFDNLGRICLNGGDFSRAEKDGAFPIHWVWPDQNLFEAIDRVQNDQSA